MAAHPSSNQRTVSARTLVAEIRCAIRKHAETLCRYGRGWQRVKAAAEPSRCLSGDISVSDGSGSDRSTPNSKGSLLPRTVERQNSPHLSGGKCRELYGTVSDCERPHLGSGKHRELRRTVAHTIGYRIASTLERIGSHSRVHIAQNSRVHLAQNSRVRIVAHSKSRECSHNATVILQSRAQDSVTFRNISSAYVTDKPGLCSTNVLCDNLELAQVRMYYSATVLLCGHKHITASLYRHVSILRIKIIIRNPP
jgi:hypothetical protein